MISDAVSATLPTIIEESMIDVDDIAGVVQCKNIGFALYNIRSLFCKIIASIN